EPCVEVLREALGVADRLLAFALGLVVDRAAQAEEHHRREREARQGDGAKPGEGGLRLLRAACDAREASRRAGRVVKEASSRSSRDVVAAALASGTLGSHLPAPGTRFPRSVLGRSATARARTPLARSNECSPAWTT